MDPDALALLHRAAREAEASRVRSDEVADRLDAMAIALDDMREKQTVLAVEARFHNANMERMAGDYYGPKGTKAIVDAWRAQISLLLWMAGGNGIVGILALAGTAMQHFG